MPHKTIHSAAAAFKLLPLCSIGYSTLRGVSKGSDLTLWMCIRGTPFSSFGEHDISCSQILTLSPPLYLFPGLSRLPLQPYQLLQRRSVKTQCLLPFVSTRLQPFRLSQVGSILKRAFKRLVRNLSPVHPPDAGRLTFLSGPH